MIQKARKNPIIIDFIKYDGSNSDEILEFVKECGKFESNVGSSSDGNGGLQSYSKLKIMTKEGEMLVSEGDMVIKEPFSTDYRKFYPCKPDIFAKTYQILEN